MAGSPLRRLAPVLATAALSLALMTPVAEAQQGVAPPGRVYAVSAPAPDGFDRERAAAETRTHLDRLIGLDTQNPPGNELLAARYLERVFSGIPGVETHVLIAGDGRANFIARLRAPRATGRPVIVMGHMDVVGADAARWSTPPFVATERNGYVYGRGAIDDKGMLAAAAAAIAQLAERRDSLTRDIIFLGTAGEEGGPPVGIDWVLENHPEMLGDAEFALNEGGRIRVRDAQVYAVNVQTTEKISYNVLATASGPSGHGSVPIPDNALGALARAAARVHEWRAPARLNSTTRLYFERLAAVEPDLAMRDAMRAISAAGADSAAIARAAAVLSREPLHNAVLRPAASLTMIRGGFRTNVIPADGSATFNVRVLPDDDISRVVTEMQATGGEEQVRFRLDGDPREAPPASPVTTALFRAMERAATTMVPTVTVIPFMSTGATDGAALRAHGIPTYGILPFPLVMEDELRMHGDEERVPVAALGWASEFLFRVLHGVTR